MPKNRPKFLPRVDFAKLNEIFKALPPNCQTKLHTLVDAIFHYNQKYNITGFKNKEAIFTNFILESLLFFELETRFDHLQGPLTGIDIGSGAGIPGFILALCHPNLKIDSVDKSYAKIEFQQEFCKKEGVKNFFPHQILLEEWLQNQDRIKTYHLLVVRAFRPLLTLLQFLTPFSNPEIQIYLWQGQNWEKEWQKWEEKSGVFQLKKVLPYQIEVENGKRENFLLQVGRA